MMTNVQMCQNCTHCIPRFDKQVWIGEYYFNIPSQAVGYCEIDNMSVWLSHDKCENYEPATKKGLNNDKN